MNTDTKAVARFDLWGFDGFMEPQEQGSYVLFTDHERVVADFVKVVDSHRGIIADFIEDIDSLRAALAASRAEVEGLKKDAERYRWLREDYDPSIHDEGFEPLFSLGPENLDAEIDAMIDAAMEKGNV